MRREVQAGVLGRPRHARFVMSAHLADWHPWERYQDFFMARAEQGGGALLDESHFLDLALWLFGPPREIYGRAEKISTLDITADDNVDLIAAYDDGLRVAVHLDLYGRPHEKSITVTGEGGTLQCLFDPHRLRKASDAAGPWDETAFRCDRNDMFVGVASEFLEMIARRRPPSCTIAHGVEVLRCVEAVRASTAEGRAVRMEWP
jgi:predicted dehydrogenase